jgi:putative transcriptional regulator
MDHTEETDGGGTMPQERFLDGQILIAMPSMQDPRFQRSLVYLCAHSGDGAMGLIVNREADGLTLAELFAKLGVPAGESANVTPVRYGGPVEPGRGFVLHSSDYQSDEATLAVDANTAMTATLEVLHAMSAGTGPRDAFVALGYAGWAPGQLEEELRENGWLTCEPDRDLLFGEEQETKWEKALAKLGITQSMLVSSGGSA